MLDGLFHIVETLFDVLDPPRTRRAVWHPSVRFFRIERAPRTPRRARTSSASSISTSYARPGKRRGAWMDDVRSRWLRPDARRLQTPVALPDLQLRGAASRAAPRC